MKAPIGMRPLSAIRADIDEWVAENSEGVIGGEELYRHTCGTILRQTTLYATIHETILATCAGYGDVKKLALPYCPTCEPDVSAETQRTCIHEETS